MKRVGLLRTCSHGGDDFWCGDPPWQNEYSRKTDQLVIWLTKKFKSWMWLENLLRFLIYSSERLENFCVLSAKSILKALAGWTWKVIQQAEVAGINAQVRQCQEHESVTGGGGHHNILYTNVQLKRKGRNKEQKYKAMTLTWVFPPVINAPPEKNLAVKQIHSRRAQWPHCITNSLPHSRQQVATWLLTQWC